MPTTPDNGAFNYAEHIRARLAYGLGMRLWEFIRKLEE